MTTEIWEWPRATVVGHHDGDTFYADVDMGMGIVRKRTPIRLHGLNAPEIRPMQVGGREATEYLMKVLPIGEIISLSSVNYDKYGGRVDAIVTRVRDSLSINDDMVNSGHAVKRDYS